MGRGKKRGERAGIKLMRRESKVKQLMDNAVLMTHDEVQQNSSGQNLVPLLTVLQVMPEESGQLQLTPHRHLEQKSSVFLVRVLLVKQRSPMLLKSNFLILADQGVPAEGALLLLATSAHLLEEPCRSSGSGDAAAAGSAWAPQGCSATSRSGGLGAVGRVPCN